MPDIKHYLEHGTTPTEESVLGVERARRMGAERLARDTGIAPFRAIEQINDAARKVAAAREPEATQPVTIHFHGGTKALTLLTDADLEDGNVDDFEALVEKAITSPPKPHWCWIGGVYLFTQAISGVELADTTG